MISRPRILCVDDDPHMLNALRRDLHGRRGDWDVQYLTRAADALETLAEGPEAVVVTDWLMPEIDGLEFCRRLRRIESEPGRPYSYVIILTGRQEPEYLVHALDQGADDFLSKPIHPGELMARIGVGLRTVELQRRLREANERLSILASTDPLTGLHNRRRGSEVLSENLERVRRGKEDLTAILIDLDKFKEVNDRHGHEAGDAILRHAADRLRAESRAYDCVVRWGGDELLVLCPHTDAREGAAVADRLHAALTGVPVSLPDGTVWNLEASVGAVTAVRGDTRSAEELLAAADGFLYEAKSAGRNCVRGTAL